MNQESMDSYNTSSQDDANDLSLAVIGMSCAVPGAANIDEFWELLKSSKSGLTDLTEEELLKNQISHSDLNNPNYVRTCGSLPATPHFDADFFGYTPKEARFIDPQQRIFLEHAYKTLESAGVVPDTYDGRIGVFAGSGQNNYLLKNIMFSSEAREWSEFQTMLGSEKDFLATRTAYKLHLTGPAVTVQTACSTALVSLSLAYQSLINYQCDMALCGGVSLNLPMNQGYYFKEGAIYSPDGRCRPFDEKGNGTVFGSGVGIILLKRLEDAIKDNDPITAVVRSTAINNDGSDKVGFTAPSINGQADVIKEAQELANITPDMVSYVEAHGTATKLGDPIEISALTEAFGKSHSQNDPCIIGSVKSNIGHLDTAAGIIGVIKTALALKHQIIPPTLHYNSPNPELDMNTTPFKVNQTPLPWKSLKGRRIAGVSSFGIGGTNAHVILEEFVPKPRPTVSSNKTLLYPFSAKSPLVLKQIQNNLETFLKTGNPDDRIDSAYTLDKGRTDFDFRGFAISSEDQWIFHHSMNQTLNTPRLVMLFPGQHSQYSGMFKDLYDKNPFFQNALDRCFQIIDQNTGWISKDLFLSHSLDKTEIAQPLLFAAEWALGMTLKEYGIDGDLYMGHSLGEYSAACLAGAFSIEDGLKLMIHRGAVMGKAPKGQMIVIFTDQIHLEPIIPDTLDISAVNCKNQCVVSGKSEHIEEFIHLIQSHDLPYKVLSTESAFHSRILNSIVPQFRGYLNEMTFRPLQKSLISNIDGSIIHSGNSLSSQYWIDHLLKTVHFHKGLQTLPQKDESIFIEMGPGRTLSQFIRSSLPDIPSERIVQTQPGVESTKSGDQFFHSALGKIWASGGNVDIGKINNIRNGSIHPLPPYPFLKQKHWLEPDMIINCEIITDGKDIPLSRSDERSDVLQPKQDIASELEQIWFQLLGHKKIKPQDSFFSIGGDSLLAVELLSRINTRFDTKIHLRDIILNPVMEKMAGVIKMQNLHLNAPEELFPILFNIQTGDKGTPLFIIAGAHENRYYDQKNDQHSYEEDFLRYFSTLIGILDKDQPIYGFRPKGIFRGEDSHKSVYAMAECYINELKKVQPKGPYIIGGECVGGSVAYEVAQQLSRNGDEVAHLILMDTPRPSLYTCISQEFITNRRHFVRALRKHRQNILFVIVKELKRISEIYLPLTKRIQTKTRFRESSIFYQRKLLSYKPTPYNGNVTLILNEEWHKWKPNLGWDKTILPKMNIHIVPGNHVTRLKDHGEKSGRIINSIITGINSERLRPDKTPIDG